MARRISHGPEMLRGTNMNRREIIVFGAMLFVAGVGQAPASAQTFQNYRCADGTQFIVGFFEYDKRAHIQVDGRAVTLAKRLALSGSRLMGDPSAKCSRRATDHVPGELALDARNGTTALIRPCG